MNVMNLHHVLCKLLVPIVLDLSCVTATWDMRVMVSHVKVSLELQTDQNQIKILSYMYRTEF